MRGVTVDAAIRYKRSELEAQKSKVVCGEASLASVFEFSYLGCGFQADGDPRHAAEVRMAQARARFGELHHLWGAGALGLRLKIRLFAAAVCSMLAHGSEAWILSEGLCKSLRHWCACCLTIITGRSVRDESVRPSFDLVRRLRARRLKWLGGILRMDDSRILHRVVMRQQPPHAQGSLLADAPVHRSMIELKRMAEDQESWRRMLGRFKKYGTYSEARDGSEQTLSYLI